MTILWPNGLTTPPPFSWQGQFGPRNANLSYASTYHRGQDFYGFSTVHAIADGEVVHVGRRAGWAGGGYMVWIQHNGFFSRSLHMAEGSARVKVGQRVTAGQAIGTMGNTNGGAAGMAVHLHLEITPGQWHASNTGQVDPRAFLEARVGKSGTAAGSGGGSSAASTTGKQAAMEAYVLAPDGTVVHLRTGGKTNFTSAKHYSDHQAAVKKLIAAKATDLISPPTIDNVPKVTWAQFETICDAIGAPKS